MFQASAFQNSAFQTIAAIIATVMVFRSLYTTTKLAANLTTTVMLQEGDFSG